MIFFCELGTSYLYIISLLACLLEVEKTLPDVPTIDVKDLVY